MSKPDTQSLHEFAWEIVLDHAQDIERMSVGEIMADNEMFEGLSEDEFDEVQGVVYDQARAYAKALMRPAEQSQDERDAEITKLRADLAEMTGCRNAAMAYAERQHVPIELDDEIDIDGEELASRIEGELLGPGWDWEDDRTPGLLAKQAVAVIRPHLARLTDQAQKARAAMAEAQAERDGATQAVAEAVSILEGMLNEGAWAYDAGRARGVLLDYFARDLDALEARDVNGGEQP